MTHETDRIDALHAEHKILTAENTRLKARIARLETENAALRRSIASSDTEIIAPNQDGGNRCRAGKQE